MKIYKTNSTAFAKKRKALIEKHISASLHRSELPMGSSCDGDKVTDPLFTVVEDVYCGIGCPLSYRMSIVLQDV